MKARPKRRVDKAPTAPRRTKEGASAVPTARDVSVDRDLAFPRAAGAEFLMSAPSVDRLAAEVPFEVAVIGRSNVGKSSFINRVCNKRHLAHASSTPGRTQHVVLFSLYIETAVPKAGIPVVPLTLADLPGFGYAKLSKRERGALGVLIDSYLQERSEARLICILNDARRDPEHEELAVQAYAAERGVPYLVIVTKSDKLTRSELGKREKELAKAYGLEPKELVITGERIPVQAFWSRVLSTWKATDASAFI
jgi:GTP-binding protein